MFHSLLLALALGGADAATIDDDAGGLDASIGQVDGGPDDTDGGTTNDGGTGATGGGSGTTGGGSGTGAGTGATGGGNGTGGGSFTGGGSGTGGGATGTGGSNGTGGGGAPSLDAGSGFVDAGSPTDPAQSWADLAWTAFGDVSAAIWVDDRRDLSFSAGRRRGDDLWINAGRPDAGLVSPYGQILCPASAQEHFSLPRIAISPTGVVVVVWRVSQATAAGHSIRVAAITATGPSSCSEVLVPNDGNPILSLALRESLGEFFVAWTTPSEVRGQYVRQPATPPVTLASAADPIVTLAAAQGGFLAAWEQRELFWSVDIPTFGSGRPVSAPVTSFTGYVPLRQATAAGPQPRGAFLSGSPLRVHFGPLVTATVADNPMEGPQAGVHRLVTASLGLDRHYVAHETATPGRFQVTEFGVTIRTTAMFPAGLSPQAIVTDGRKGLLLLGGREPTLAVVQLVPQPVGPPQIVTPFTTTQSQPTQLGASLVRTPTGGWVLGWNQATAYLAVPLAPDGTPGTIISRPRVGGFSWLTQVADGAELAVNVAGIQGTNVYPYTLDSGPGTMPLLTATGERRVAVVGRQTAAVWSAGSDSVTFGRGSPAPLSFGGGRLGRCGVWAGNALFIPMMENGGELRVIELKDEEGSAPVVHPVATGTRGVQPCLVARGSDFLVVAAESTGDLFLLKTSLADVRADILKTPIPLVATPTGRAIALPVAAPTPLGWQLAWESADDTTSVIVGMVLNADGSVRSPPAALALGLDLRTPTLAPSAGGLVALSWEQFVDQTGNVEVKTRFLAQDGTPTDGGVTEPVFDAGVTEPAPDAGVQMQPIVYSSCGCQAGALPSLVGLAFLLFSRRRARARS